MEAWYASPDGARAAPDPGERARSDPDTLIVPGPEVVVHALRGTDRLRDIPAPAFVISRETLQRTAQPRLSSVLQWLPGLNAYQSGATGEPSVVDPRGFTAERRDLVPQGAGERARHARPRERQRRLGLDRSRGRRPHGGGGGRWRVGLRRRCRGRHRQHRARRGALGARAARAAAVRQLRPARRQPGRQLGRRPVGHGTRRRRTRRGRLARPQRRAHSQWPRAPEPAHPGQLAHARRRVALDASPGPGRAHPDEMAADRNQAATPLDYLDSDRANVSVDATHGDEVHGLWTLTPYYRAEDFRQVRTLVFTPLYHPTNGSTWGADLGWRRSFTMGGRPLKLAASYTPSRPTSTAATMTSAAAAPAHRRRAAGHGAPRSRGRSPGSSILTAGTVARGRALRRDPLHVSQPLHRGARRGPGHVGAESVRVAEPAHARSGRGLRERQRRLPRARRSTSSSISGRSRPVHRPRSRRSSPSPTPICSRSARSTTRWVRAGIARRARRPCSTSTPSSCATQIDFDLGTFSYDNIGKRSARRRARRGAALPLGRGVTAMVSGTWSPTTISGGPLDGNQINAVPLGSAAGRLEWSAASWTSLNGGVRWVARQYLDKENEHPLADYTVADVGLVLRRSMARLDVQVLNLFDHKYADTGSSARSRGRAPRPRGGPGGHGGARGELSQDGQRGRPNGGRDRTAHLCP